MLKLLRRTRLSARSRRAASATRRRIRRPALLAPGAAPDPAAATVSVAVDVIFLALAAVAALALWLIARFVVGALDLARGGDSGRCSAASPCCGWSC